MASSFLVFGLLFFVFSRTSIGQEKETTKPVQKALTDFSQSYCIDCHQGDGAEAEFDIEQLIERSNFRKDYDHWNKVIQKVRDRSMPPADYDQPSDEERSKFVKELETQIENYFCGKESLPPVPLVRRLNRTEYANTIRDLLGISIDVSAELPDDGAGGEGFDNAAETLFISPIHAEKYLSCASKAIEHALKDPRSRRVVLGNGKNQNESDEEFAKRVLSRFLFRAFRRPVSKENQAKYFKLFQISYKRTDSLDQALGFALKGALISPKFLFLNERFKSRPKNETESPQVLPLDDFTIASRLSYFLWASMPDHRLLELAKSGKLQNENVLKKQLTRMTRAKIQGRPKVRDFAESFVSQWLETRRLGREYVPDKKVAPRFDSELLGGMKYEPIFFFEDLITKNHSVLNLIEADYTFVNRRLARHYRIPGEFREQPKLTQLKKGNHRGGVLSMAAVLAVSSYPHRTSPVLRGKYVLETILGQSTPPPPEDVPPLIEEKVKSPASLRQQLELHRKNVACASCHNQMDPIGFGLENYDILGRYRTRTKGKKIDNKGVLPDGTTFFGPVGLQKVLLKKKDQFHRNLTEKLLGFALSRGLRPEDRCVAKEIAKKNSKSGYRIQNLLEEIILSKAFRSAATISQTSADDQSGNKQ